MEKATFRILCLSLLLTSTSVFSQGGTDFIGQVLYHVNYPMSGVSAYLHAPGGNIVDSAVTNTAGYYEFENVSPGNYTISFSTPESAGGVELSDAFLVMLRLFNLYTFTPIQTLAADVNGSGTITWTDYFLILIGYLNLGNPFPIGPWVFQTASVTIPAASRDGFITHSGSSSGDVSGSLVPDPKNNSIFLNNPVVNLTAGPSDPIEFNLACVENLQIAGMHLAIRVPDGLNVINVESSISEASISISGGQIKVTWIDATRQGIEIAEGSPLLIIRTRATDLSRDGNSYSLRLGGESHFINTGGELIRGVNLSLPTINLKVQNEITHLAYPNPFLSYSTLDYRLLQDGHVIIALFDQSGRQVQEMENGDRSAGSHQVKIDGSSLLPGIYHYSIRFDGSGKYLNTGTIIKSR